VVNPVMLVISLLAPEAAALKEVLARAAVVAFVPPLARGKTPVICPTGKLIELLLADVIRPLLSTAITGTAEEEP